MKDKVSLFRIRAMFSFGSRMRTLSVCLLMMALALGSSISASAQQPFITTWKTDNAGTSSSNQITIPGEGSNYAIHWEEVGNPANQGNVTGNRATTLTFPSAGTYQVSISPGAGTFHQIAFNNGGDRLKLLSIDQWGSIAWSNMGGAFYGCENMTYNATDIPDLSNVTSLFFMFARCAQFNGAIGNWDISNVTSLQGMFFFATAFNQPISNWDVSNVTNMISTFSGATSFNQPIGSWDVSNVNNMRTMFSGATAFNQPIDDWDVTNVNNMSSMLSSARAFNQPIGNWNVSNVTTMNRIFSGATAFNQPIGDWNVSNVVDMTFMFAQATAFNQPIGDWNVEKVTTMNGMFSNARAFNQEIGNWNVGNVTNMRAMFSVATVFNQPIGNWNVGKMTDMESMFDGARDFNQPISNWDVSNVTNMRNMFTFALAFNQPIGNWDVGNVGDMFSMFQAARAFNQPIGNWNVSNVTNMSLMFSGASAFNQNLGTWTLNSSVDLSSFLDSSGMDCLNYSATLQGWAANPATPDGRNLGASGRQYGTNAVAARNTLLAKGWTISGDVASGTLCQACETITAEISGTSDVCSGADANISAAITGGVSPYTLIYSPDGGTTNITVNNYQSGEAITLSPATTTTYTLVSVTDGNGCTADLVGSATITVETLPTASISGTPTGCGSVSLIASGGTTYQWNGGSTPTQAENTFTSSGVYTVTVTNEAGCSSEATVEVTITSLTFYLDSDGDGFGDPSVSIQDCSAPVGYVSNNTDCDDNDADLNPNTVWYLDADNDGYYTGSGITQCESPGEGYRFEGLKGGSDCNDNDPAINPGATEVCDGLDNNCNGQIDEGCSSNCNSLDASASSQPVPAGSPATLSATMFPALQGITVQFALINEAGITTHYLQATTLENGTATATVTGLTLGVYQVNATADCGTSVAYLPVYDASGSFVTGGGWFTSPEGAMPAQPDVTGKANFGFVAKYKKGNNQVEGTTDFQFSAGNLSFKSNLHENGSLVISGRKATYRGEGTVNDEPGYRFTLTALDGQWNGGSAPDQFRIKIWNDLGIVYDNQLGAADNADASTALGGGNIMIHDPKGKNKREVTSELEESAPIMENSLQMENSPQMGDFPRVTRMYPNPVSDQIVLEFGRTEEDEVEVSIYDMKGEKLLAIVSESENEKIVLDISSLRMKPGVFVLLVRTKGQAQVFKFLKK
ncbi:MAG: BspA family leucine-rich repeat surface protein [Lunatimonas sp.]|uniref:BspA family leucine-rich repeat surface protein n=1 Tax=Lunatimonas sp. TaxID=2060141 RepID=UPI00263BA514|nr:BspA family leucine-rich repeat surface protein [Lunatimonas sp.]MCC5939423.1 BspA family leucine-rich repeat surface protein [Lunatimonas sp.]